MSVSEAILDPDVAPFGEACLVQAAMSGDAYRALQRGAFRRGRSSASDPDRPSAQTGTEKEHSSLRSAVNGQGRLSSASTSSSGATIARTIWTGTPQPTWLIRTIMVVRAPVEAMKPNKGFRINAMTHLL